MAAKASVMNITRPISRCALAIFLGSVCLAPTAFAAPPADYRQRAHDTRHHHAQGRDRAHRDHQRDREWNKDWRHRDRHYDRRDRNHDRWHDDHGHNRFSHGGPEVYVYRHSDHWPRYSPRWDWPRSPGFSTHHRYYTPRYRVGGHYRPHQRTVYISDYYHWGLRTPPRHHHWVRDPYCDDALLVSAASGAIIGLVVGAFATGY